MLEILARHPSPQCPPHLCPACRTSAGEYSDQNHPPQWVRDVIFSAAQSAALRPSREAQGLIPESLSRPVDVFLPTWQGGRDVHVISPLQQTLIHEAAFSPGHALEVGVRRKLTTHASTGLPLHRCKLHSHCGRNTRRSRRRNNQHHRCHHRCHRKCHRPESNHDAFYILHQEASVSSPGHCTLERKCLPVASSPTNFPSFSGWYPLNCMPPPPYLLVCCFCTFVLF